MYYLILNLDNNSSKILMCLRGVSYVSFPGNINAKILIHRKNDLLVFILMRWIVIFLKQVKLNGLFLIETCKGMRYIILHLKTF